MYNPFDGTMPPVEKSNDFIGRRNIYERLNEKIQNQQNIVLQGVKGSGKTSVLRTFFSSQYKIKMAGDKNIFLFICHVTECLSSFRKELLMP